MSTPRYKKNFQDDDSLIFQLSSFTHMKIVLIHRVSFLLKPYVQQNGDGSKVTPSLKGLADVTVVNIQLAAFDK